MDDKEKEIKEKTFTEGVEDSRQKFDKEDQDKNFDPLKIKM